MNYSLGNIISNGGVLSRFNPIAVARINAIYAAGGSAPVGQRTATQLLSDFINAEQSAGRWANHRRIYIPGWSNAAANAIDIVSGNSGTFTVSGVTHATGFVRGDGSTGRFVMDTDPTTLGLVDGSASIWRLVRTAHTSTAYNVPMGVTQTTPSARRPLRFERSAGNSTFGTGANITAATAGVGIFFGSETATNSRYFRLRTSSGVVSLGTNTTTVTGGFPTLAMSVMSVRNDSNFASFTNAELGAYGLSLGMSTAAADGFTANLRTLWEGLFQLSLP